MAAAICYGVLRDGGAQLAFHVPAGNYDSDTWSEVLGSCRYGRLVAPPTHQHE